MTAPRETLTDGTVLLRRCAPADAVVVHRVVAESLSHLRPWMPWAHGDYGLAEAREFLAASDREWRSGDTYNYLILVADTLAGVAGLHRRIGPGGLEIGYWLSPAHTGHGYATRATALLTDHALALPDVDHVQIWHDAANTASAAIPRRLGYTETARRTPPRDPMTPDETGTDVIWERRTPISSRVP
jgi:ribosomal-protein-serine acetyltransferase